MQRSIQYLINIFFCSYLLLDATLGMAWPKISPVPGGIVDITLPYTENQEPEVTFHGRRVAVAFNGGTWHALIGIPIDLAPGLYEAEIRLPIQKKLAFNLKEKRYPEQHITLTKKKEMINPSPKTQMRILKERAELGEIYQHWSDAYPFKLVFDAPVKGRISSMFGLKRYFNKVPKDPHLGLDIAAAEGSEVKAAAEGVVILAKNLYYTGNTVIIDHGLGTFSLYGHLKKLLATPGRHVAAGNVIGLVGQTGRATGPHLHFGMVMNQTKIDPLLYVTKNSIVPPVKAKAMSKKTR